MIENLREQKEREERARLEELQQMRKENQELKDKLAAVLPQKQLGTTGQNHNQSQNQSQSLSLSQNQNQRPNREVGSKDRERLLVLFQVQGTVVGDFQNKQ